MYYFLHCLLPLHCSLYCLLPLYCYQFQIPLTVFHGTKRDNFSKIMNGNLRVPDGRLLLHTTDTGYFGKGVYTSPDFGLALTYSANGPIFVCLALPGKQFLASQATHLGKPCQPGFDSHYEASGTELVFFESDQLFPIFIADGTQINAATAQATKV